MRKIVGKILLAVSLLTGAILYATGHLGSEHTTSHSVDVNEWVTISSVEVDFDPNWSLALPIMGCVLLGGLCAFIPQRKPST